VRHEMSRQSKAETPRLRGRAKGFMSARRSLAHSLHFNRGAIDQGPAAPWALAQGAARTPPGEQRAEQRRLDELLDLVACAPALPPLLGIGLRH
jgi:hypothetical protein